MIFTKLQAVAASVFGAAMAMGSVAAAAPVTPTFGTFGDLTTLNGGQVDFGGSGIPTDPAAITDFVVGNDRVRVGIIATQRFASPPLSNDGAGTYTALAGESAPGLSQWNFSFFAESTGDLADANLKLHYDLDPTAGTDLSGLGVFDISAIMPQLPDPSVFEGSQNLGFGFLASGAPGVTAPAFAGPFDPFATGEYSFRIGVDGGDFAAINVNVGAVPLPAGAPLILTALGALVWLRRRAA